MTIPEVQISFIRYLSVPKALSFLLILIAASAAQAQSSRVLRLEDCLRVAMEQSLQLRSAENSIRGFRLAQSEVNAGTLPQFKLSATASHAPTSSNFGYDPAISNGGQISGLLVLRENLYEGGARGVRSTQASLNLEQGEMLRRKSEHDVRLEVTSEFFDLLAANRTAEIQRARVEDLSQYLKLVTQLFHGGRVGYSDVLKTEVDLRNVRVALDKADQNSETTKIALATSMGMPNDTAFTVIASMELSPAVVDSTVHSIGREPRNLDLAIAQLDVRRSELDIDLSKSERQPMITLFADAGVVTSGENLQLPSPARVPVLGYSVGITVENLLFDWGVTSSRIQQREVEAETRKLQFELHRRVLTAELASRQSQIQHTFQQLSILRQNVKSAEDNYVLTKSLYAGGGTLALEVISAEQLLSDTRINELQALLDLRKLTAIVERLRAQ